MTAPWYRVDVAWWPAIAASLTHPWPEEAILADLRWWADQEKVGRAVRPGRPALARRWGVTDHRAKTILRSGAWEDHQQLTSNSPAEHQTITSGSPARRRVKLANLRKVTSGSPATHQQLTSASPADRPARVYPQSDRDTEHRAQSTETQERAHAREACVSDPEPVTAPGPTPEAVAPMLPGMVEAPKGKKGKRVPDADVARVWTHYRARCPERRGETPPGYLADRLPRAIREFGVDKIELLIDWLAGDDERPTFLRSVGKAWKETPFLPGHLRDYVAMAEEWDARGRRTSAAPAGGKKSSFQLAKEALERAIAAEGVQAMPPDVIDMGDPPPNVYHPPQREQATPPRAAVVGARPSWMEDPDGLDF